jgi:hypothetical protein
MVRPENYTNVWQIVGQHLSKRTNDLYVEFHFVLTHSEKELGEAFHFNVSSHPFKIFTYYKEKQVLKPFSL